MDRSRLKEAIAQIQKRIEVREKTLSIPYLSPTQFTIQHCKIHSDEHDGQWIPFHLWPAQAAMMAELPENRLVAALKARQVGWTWWALAYGLHKLIYRPGSTVLLFSRRDTEAVDLLKRRLRGMHARLPESLQRHGTGVCNDHEWELSNGSRCMAFPTTAGDSYTATLAIVDEADLIPNLDDLLSAVKPTIDAGGQLILLSKSNKAEPNSPFKRIYRAARNGENSYHAMFLPWQSRPDRTPEWYAEQQRDSLANTGSLDYVHENYPATEEEALSARSLDKRLPRQWLSQCYQEMKSVPSPLALPGLKVFVNPVASGAKYVVSADPAEGNPTSDDSAACVMEKRSGQQVAEIVGKFEPATFAAYLLELCFFYNRASLLVERNNHGGILLMWLKENTKQFKNESGKNEDYRVHLLKGQDDRPGWLTTTKSKAMMYGLLAESLRDQECSICSFETMMQLQSIEGSTLSAPEGDNDDRAVAYALVVVACGLRGVSSWAGEYGFVK